MNDKYSKSSLENGKQSLGNDSSSVKRNSGLFSFFKWLKPTGVSRESLNSDKANNNSSSCESLSSVQSSGTVASFSFVEPSAYTNNLSQKSIPQSPETDTYRARLKQRDKSREKDKNLTLRRKYNLFFNRDTLLKTVISKSEESTKSLPLMTKPTMKEETPEESFHRRTNSDSSKIKKAGAYLHVKGKRKAPQPPGNSDDNTTSLRRKNKRLAPAPPPTTKEEKPQSPLIFRKLKSNSIFYQRSESSEKIGGSSKPSPVQETKIEPVPLSNEETPKRTVMDIIPKELEDSTKLSTEIEKVLTKNEEKEIISNDSLKLDHGILKPVKVDDQNIYSECSPFPSKDPSDGSKLWYKRHETSAQLKREFLKTRHENKYEPIERFPEVSFNRNSTIELNSDKTNEKKKEDKQDKKKEEKHEKKKDDKRKSGLSLLANISELDREAAEILQKEKMKKSNEIPDFMKPKSLSTEEDNSTLSSPKRRSARDLIAKFNAITNVTKVTVNTALFGSSHKDSRKNYFGKSSPNETKKHQEALLESHKKRIDMIDKKLGSDKKLNSMIPLLKSESASVVKKPDTPKSERKGWNCPKCYIENEYWRIICHVCSTIKPYFDDLAASPNLKKNDRSIFKEPTQNQYERVLERSKTQIGFSALSNGNKKKFDTPSPNVDKGTYKSEEKEKLKRMLIEMKNSLPKKELSARKTARTSIIIEKPEMEVKKIPQDSSSESDTSDTDNEEVTTNNSPTLPCKEVKEEQKVVNVEEKVASVIIATKETIYENIKMKKTAETKPVKVSSSVQTSSVISKNPEPSKRLNVTAMVKKKNSFEPMKVTDFEDIYSDQDGKSAARIYANLAQNDELSLFFNMPKDLTEVKNTLSKMKMQNRNKDTIEINRLLRRLEVAIGKGDMNQAADFAKELAQLKVNCSVIRQKSESEERELQKAGFSVDMFVEDKISHRGPFPIQVKPDQTVGELKRQVEQEFEIPINVQRWILGKELVTNDSTTLKDNNITDGCPIFLYLVAPDSNLTKPDTKCQENVGQTKESIPSSSGFSRNEISTEDPPPKPSSSGFSRNEISTEDPPPKPSTDPPRLYPQIDLSISEIYNELTQGPKIVDAIPKTQEPPQTSETIEGATTSSMGSKETSEIKLEKHNFNEVVTQTVTTVLHAPLVSLAQPEDDDMNTLKPTTKPSNEWKCHLCTLLNPLTSNICGVCATVRQIPPKKIERRKTYHKPNAPIDTSSGQTYLQLMNLDNEDLVSNSDKFECVVCFTDIAPLQGVTLRECLHQFCKDCLRHTIEFSDEAEVKCPYRDEQYSCNIALQDREIKSLVSKTVYDQHLAKSVAQAENQMDKSFHCKTPDCKGWCIFEDNVNDFKCPVCRKLNCLTCQAIHMGLNCKQYQQRVTEESQCDEDAKQTRRMLDEMVEKGEALKCPTCQVIMMKKWGCDWLRCSMCKTEICWVTRGPRWGPAGKGDTSGGCQCGVNGVKCHPKCNYCH